MGSRTRQEQLAARAARQAIDYLAEEIQGGRADRNLSQARLGAFASMSRTQVGRAERGALQSLTIAQAAHLAAGLGLRLSIKAYPVGEPIRDAAQQALLAAFRDLISPTLPWAREVPLPGDGDLRAWDAVVSGKGWRYGVEAETRPRDVQALIRRLALKLRDGRVEGVLLVLRDSGANRELLERHAADIATVFPVGGNLAVGRLAAGTDPGGNSVVLVPTAPSVVARLTTGRLAPTQARQRPGRDGSRPGRTEGRPARDGP